MPTLISIHAPHEGERRVANTGLGFGIADFNPRSPRGGATRLKKSSLFTTAYFNPRSPRGGATFFAVYGYATLYISIHAPHEGERRSYLPAGVYANGEFQSTLPTRGSDS